LPQKYSNFAIWFMKKSADFSADFAVNFVIKVLQIKREFT